MATTETKTYQPGRLPVHWWIMLLFAFMLVMTGLMAPRAVRDPRLKTRLNLGGLVLVTACFGYLGLRRPDPVVAESDHLHSYDGRVPWSAIRSVERVPLDLEGSPVHALMCLVDRHYPDHRLVVHYAEGPDHSRVDLPVLAGWEDLERVIRERAPGIRTAHPPGPGRQS